MTVVRAWCLMRGGHNKGLVAHSTLDAGEGGHDVGSESWMLQTESCKFLGADEVVVSQKNGLDDELGKAVFTSRRCRTQST